MLKKAILVGVIFLFAAGSVDAAEKAEVLSRIEGARAAVENFAAKVANNGAVVADVEAARSYLRKAGQAFEEGKQMFGLGRLKPAAEQEISHCLGMAELNISLADSRLAKGKTSEELAAINAQLDKVKAKVKVFEDKKTAMEKLRVDAAKYEAAAKELAALKTEKALLISQVEMLMAERKQFEKQLEELKGTSAKRAEQVEKSVPVTKPVIPTKPESAAVPAPVIPAKAPVPGASPADRQALEELVVPEREKASPAKEPPAAMPAPVVKPVAAAAPEAAPVPAPASPAAAPVPDAAPAGSGALDELVAPQTEKAPAPAAAAAPPEGEKP